MKLLLALFVVANFGHSQCQSFPADAANIQREIEGLVRQYKGQATGNADFSQLVEECYYISQLPNNKENMYRKYHKLWQLKRFIKTKQELDAQIDERLKKIDQLIRVKGDSCRSFFKYQKRILQKAYNFSNTQKTDILAQSSKACGPNVREYDNDSDYYL